MLSVLLPYVEGSEPPVGVSPYMQTRSSQPGRLSTSLVPPLLLLSPPWKAFLPSSPELSFLMPTRTARRTPSSSRAPLFSHPQTSPLAQRESTDTEPGGAGTVNKEEACGMQHKRARGSRKDGSIRREKREREKKQDFFLNVRFHKRMLKVYCRRSRTTHESDDLNMGLAYFVRSGQAFLAHAAPRRFVQHWCAVWTELD